jgi:hypothetical protein
MADFFLVRLGVPRKALTFPSPRFVVGSVPEAGLRLHGLEPLHAEFSIDPFDTVWVRSLTRAGTLSVDGVPTTNAPVPVGAVVRVGPVELRLHDSLETPIEAHAAMTALTPALKVEDDDFDTRDEPPTHVSDPGLPRVR